MKRATPLTDEEVAAAYRDNPASVHRSVTDDWHEQVYYDFDKGLGDLPRAYRSGQRVIITPDYPLPASTPQLALFPGVRRSAQAGLRPAKPVSHEEVVAAYRADPDSVHRSLDQNWHRQIYQYDQGPGDLPRAYRSGRVIIIDPTYPL